MSDLLARMRQASASVSSHGYGIRRPLLSCVKRLTSPVKVSVSVKYSTSSESDSPKSSRLSSDDGGDHTCPPTLRTLRTLRRSAGGGGSAGKSGGGSAGAELATTPSEACGSPETPPSLPGRRISGRCGTAGWFECTTWTRTCRR